MSVTVLRATGNVFPKFCIFLSFQRVCLDQPFWIGRWYNSSPGRTDISICFEFLKIVTSGNCCCDRVMRVKSILILIGFWAAQWLFFGDRKFAFKPSNSRTCIFPLHCVSIFSFIWGTFFHPIQQISLQLSGCQIFSPFSFWKVITRSCRIF